jgi:hypothetical protein
MYEPDRRDKEKCHANQTVHLFSDVDLAAVLAVVEAMDVAAVVQASTGPNAP